MDLTKEEYEEVEKLLKLDNNYASLNHFLGNDYVMNRLVDGDWYSAGWNTIRPMSYWNSIGVPDTPSIKNDESNDCLHEYRYIGRFKTVTDRIYLRFYCVYCLDKQVHPESSLFVVSDEI